MRCKSQHLWFWKWVSIVVNTLQGHTHHEDLQWGHNKQTNKMFKIIFVILLNLQHLCLETIFIKALIHFAGNLGASRRWRGRDWRWRLCVRSGEERLRQGWSLDPRVRGRVPRSRLVDSLTAWLFIQMILCDARCESKSLPCKHFDDFAFVSLSETAAQGVPEGRGQCHADLHLLCQRRQTGEQRQQAHLHSEFSNDTTHHPHHPPL